MKAKNKVLNDHIPLLEEKFGWARTEMILGHAEPRWQQLCDENSGDSKAVKAHTEKKIFPAIALYFGMQKSGISKEEALSFLDWSHSHLAEPQAASMRAMCKIPGVYKLMPGIFKFVTVHQFGEKAGFAANFYDEGKTRCKFDMTRCLYCDVCRKYGVPELIQCFCHTDDVTDGNIHPKLLWNRTKTMGEGGDVCDFDLILVDTPEKGTKSEE